MRTSIGSGSGGTGCRRLGLWRSFAYAQAAAERIGGRCAGERGGEVPRAS